MLQSICKLILSEVSHKRSNVWLFGNMSRVKLLKAGSRFASRPCLASEKHMHVCRLTLKNMPSLSHIHWSSYDGFTGGSHTTEHAAQWRAPQAFTTRIHSQCHVLTIKSTLLISPPSQHMFEHLNEYNMLCECHLHKIYTSLGWVG